MNIMAIILETKLSADKHGIPISKICEKAGLFPSTYYRWRDGLNAPTISKYNAFMNAFTELKKEKGKQK
jgi:hypothetical protein